MPHLCVFGPTTIINMCCCCFISPSPFLENSLPVFFMLLPLVCDLSMKDLFTLRNRICQNWPATQVTRTVVLCSCTSLFFPPCPPSLRLQSPSVRLQTFFFHSHWCTMSRLEMRRSIERERFVVVVVKEKNASSGAKRRHFFVLDHHLLVDPPRLHTLKASHRNSKFKPLTST